MKKLFTVLLVLLASFAVFADSAFASGFSPDNNPVYANLLDPFQPTDVRSLGMGGVGVVSLEKNQAFYKNPAALGQKGLQISMPSAAVTVYHPFGLYQSMKERDFEFTEENIAAAILENLNQGYGAIADVDASLSFAGKGFGFAVNVKDSILTYQQDGISGGQFTTNIYDRLNASILLGLGHRFSFTRSISLDLGFSVGFNYLAYSEAYNATILATIMKGDYETFLKTAPILAGWSVPVTVGATVNLPLGLSVSTVYRNLNGKYNMSYYSNYEELAKKPFKSDETFTFKTKSSLDAGVAWTPIKTKLFSPTIEADVVDILGLIAEESIDTKTIISHLKAGAELDLIWCLSVRGGLDRGYWTVGAGLNLALVKVQAAYYWHEFGEVIGSNGLDGFSLSVNVGW